MFLGRFALSLAFYSSFERALSLSLSLADDSIHISSEEIDTGGFSLRKKEI